MSKNWRNLDDAMRMLKGCLLAEDYDGAHRVVNGYAEETAPIEPHDPIVKLGLPLRVVHALERQGILTVRALQRVKASQFLSIPDLGQVELEHLRELFKKAGLSHFLSR